MKTNKENQYGNNQAQCQTIVRTDFFICLDTFYISPKQQNEKESRTEYYPFILLRVLFGNGICRAGRACR